MANFHFYLHNVFVKLLNLKVLEKMVALFKLIIFSQVIFFIKKNVK